MDSFAESLLDLARQKGVSFAEVYQASAISRPAIFEANRLKQLETSESTGTALRLWYQGRPGVAVAYGSVSPEQLVEKAIALSQLNESIDPDPCPSYQGICPSIGQCISVESLIEMGKKAIAQLRDAYPEITCGGVFDCESSQTMLVNSDGLYCTAQETSSSCGLEVEWIRGDDFLGIYDDAVSQGVPQVQPMVASLLERLQWAAQNVTAPRKRLPVILSSNAAPLLWSTVAEALNGKNIVEGTSPWSQRLGEQVADSKITLYQDPSASPYCCFFDDEGTPTQSLKLIEEGMANIAYGDRLTARKLGIPPAGNGFRPSLSHCPSPGLINLMIKPGSGNINSILSQFQEAVLVDQVLGDGADLAGDFSLNIDLGYHIKQGQVMGRIKDAMLVGNIYDAIQSVIKVGQDNHWQGFFHTPSLALESLSIIS